MKRKEKLIKYYKTIDAIAKDDSSERAICMRINIYREEKSRALGFSSIKFTFVSIEILLQSNIH